MREALISLFNNPAFWVFLGTFVTSYFGYKQIVKKSPANIAKAKIKSASSFEELRAVVEVLQGELIKKDKRHKDDTDYMLSQLTEARGEVRSLTTKYGDAINRAVQAEETAQNCGKEVKKLRDLLLANGISE